MESNHIRAGLSVAIRAALEAGKHIMQIYTDPKQDFNIECKSDNSPLTIADKIAHEVISNMLHLTGLPVLSEEGMHEPYELRKDWEAFWLVDPLDGTREFIKRNGEFTVNIALVLDDRPHLGVIYVPVSGDLYFGEPFLGAFKVSGIREWNDAESLMDLIGRAKRLPFERQNKDTFVVVASRSHLSPETEDFIKRAQLEYEHVETISKGSSLKICLVAEGVADVYPRYAPTMEWDTAAGHAIASCAGKQVLQAGTQMPLLYNKEDLHNPWFLVK